MRDSFLVFKDSDRKLKLCFFFLIFKLSESMSREVTCETILSEEQECERDSREMLRVSEMSSPLL